MLTLPGYPSASSRGTSGGTSGGASPNAQGSFTRCYNDFVGDPYPVQPQVHTLANLGSAAMPAPPWLSRPIGKLSVMGLGGLALTTLMAAQWLPQTSPQAATQPDTPPTNADANAWDSTDIATEVIPPTWSETEFSKQTQTAQDLKFLADLKAASESGSSIRPPLPGQMIAQQLPILNLTPTPSPLLAKALSDLADPETSIESVAESAAPIRLAPDSPILMASTIAPPETTLVMAASLRSPIAPAASESANPDAALSSDAPSAKLQTGESQLAAPLAAIATPMASETAPATTPTAAPAIVPIVAPALTQRLPFGESLPIPESLDATTVTLNQDAALAATLGSVIDASRAPAVLPTASTQPWGTTLGATPGQPAVLSPVSQVAPPPAVLTSAQTQPTQWSDPAVQAWLSRPLPAGQPRQIAALPLTARATLDASTSNQVNNLWVLHVSAKDYQQIWLALAAERGQAVPAPEHGFIDYQRQAIIMPVV
jgi:hypothetical protein